MITNLADLTNAGRFSSAADLHDKSSVISIDLLSVGVGMVLMFVILMFLAALLGKRPAQEEVPYQSRHGKEDR